MIKRKLILSVLALTLVLTGCGKSAALPTSTSVAQTVTPTAVDQPVATPPKSAPQPTATTSAMHTKPGYFSREQLIEDARQLAHFLETAHIDPYTRGGGKMA
jgi:PBP1b-binding outer membrane lipoprotein LpoB